jgi:uncharacterized membrane protein YgcG
MSYASISGSVPRRSKKRSATPALRNSTNEVAWVGVSVGDTKNARWLRGPSPNDAGTRVVGVDHLAVPDVEADMVAPPEDVPRADLVERHLDEEPALFGGGSRQADAPRPPGSLNEPRTIETIRPRAAPAIALAELCLGELDRRAGTRGGKRRQRGWRRPGGGARGSGDSGGGRATAHPRERGEEEGQPNEHPASHRGDRFQHERGGPNLW